jgi:hypothetical protein
MQEENYQQEKAEEGEKEKHAVGRKSRHQVCDREHNAGSM